MEYINLVGFNVSRSAPTYLDSYEVPSGGDWSIHRGGAVFLDGAAFITLEQIGFDQCDGNAVFLSRFARSNTVRDCGFYRTGDTAIAAVGAGSLMNGSRCVCLCSIVECNSFGTRSVFLCCVEMISSLSLLFPSAIGETHVCSHWPHSRLIPLRDCDVDQFDVSRVQPDRGKPH